MKPPSFPARLPADVQLDALVPAPVDPPIAGSMRRVGKASPPHLQLNPLNTR